MATKLTFPKMRKVPESPAWHGAVLAERERKLACGEDTLLGWKIAKRRLRAKLRKATVEGKPLT